MRDGVVLDDSIARHQTDSPCPVVGETVVPDLEARTVYRREIQQITGLHIRVFQLQSTTDQRCRLLVRKVFRQYFRIIEFDRTDSVQSSFPPDFIVPWFQNQNRIARLKQFNSFFCDGGKADDRVSIRRQCNNLPGRTMQIDRIITDRVHFTIFNCRPPA